MGNSVKSSYIKYMVRKLTTNSQENYGELNQINYQGFKLFLVQLAALVFSLPPKNLNSLSLVEQIQLMFDTFREMTR